MIVGRGLLANSLSTLDSEEFIFYVNGISNSTITIIEEDNFEKRELKALAESYDDKTLVYFSTCMVNSIGSFSNQYIDHKYKTEVFIQNTFSRYLIIRTSNLVGKNLWNNNTLFNFLFNAIKEDIPIKINKRIKRNVMDIDDLSIILSSFLRNNPYSNCIVDLVYPRSYTMEEIVESFESYFSKKFIREETSKDIFAHFNANLEISNLLFEEVDLPSSNYLEKLLNKYYSV